MAAPALPSFYQGSGAADSPAFRLPTPAWPSAIQGSDDQPIMPVAHPVSSNWEAALADIAARAGIDHRFVESAIAATTGAAPKPAEPTLPAVGPTEQIWPSANSATTASPAKPSALWTQPPDDLMTGVSTVYSAPGLGLLSSGAQPQPLERSAAQPVIQIPEPVEPSPSLDLPELPPLSHDAKLISPVISIGLPTDETETVQFEQPVVDKPVPAYPAYPELTSEPEPVSKPEPTSKPETMSKAEEDFFGPVPDEFANFAEDDEDTSASITKVSARVKSEKPRAKGVDKPKPATVPDADEEDDAATNGSGISKDDDTTDDPPAKQKGRKSRLPGPAQWAIEIAIWVVAALILSTLIRLFVVQLFVVPSGSMENTLLTGDRIASLKYAQFERGDIVVFEDPGDWLQEPAPQISGVHRFFEKIGLLASTDQNYLVKRVIGLPGDRIVCCSNGHLMVNGVPIDESSYLKDPTQAASAFQFDVTVPVGRIFVLGDNRNSSADSRWHLCEANDKGLGMNAFVPIQNVVGPVRAVVLPFSRTGHRATPDSVFAQVPSGTDPPPSVAKVTVGAGGPNGVCHS